MKAITNYTDGACKGNPGPGGWGALILWDLENYEELSGGESQTTNNRMELTAVIEALKSLGDISYEIDLFSDSIYVINGLQKGWAKKWKENNWKRKEMHYQHGTIYPSFTEKPVKNPDLWQELLDLTEKHKMHYHWVKGHAEDQYNNRCDQLAVAESNKF